MSEKLPCKYYEKISEEMSLALKTAGVVCSGCKKTLSAPAYIFLDKEHGEKDVWGVHEACLHDRAKLEYDKIKFIEAVKANKEKDVWS